MEYNQIFQPQTLEKLNQRSQDNLKKIMGNKSLMQTMISSGKLLGEIMQIEAPYKEQLEQLAIQMIEDMYPIVIEDNIKIDAKITNVDDVNQSLDEIKVNNPTLLSTKVFLKIKSIFPDAILNKDWLNRGDDFFQIQFYKKERPILNIDRLDYDPNTKKFRVSLGPNDLNGRYFKHLDNAIKYLKHKKETINENSPEAKRRVINGITQGAALNGTFSFYMFKEYLDAIDDTLVEKYNQLMKEVFGVYDDDNAIAMFLNAIAQGQKTGGGSSKVIINEIIVNNPNKIDQSKELEKIISKLEDEYPNYNDTEIFNLANKEFKKKFKYGVGEKLNENQQGPTIQARAICFPMLVHEIIKGLYELVSLQGFSGTKDQNQQVVDKVDKLENEPHDLRYGKYIYEALNDIFADSGYDDSRIREFFFAEVYQMGDREFVEFIENVINESLTPQQQNWVKTTLKEIQMDLRSDDFDSTGLDEIKINKPGLTLNQIKEKEFEELYKKLEKEYPNLHAEILFRKAWNIIDKKYSLDESKSPCWDGYKKQGTKQKNGKTVNNCVPINENEERIECSNCDWSWDLKDGGEELYLCHKCGYQNEEEIDIHDDYINEFINELKKCNSFLKEGVLEEAEYQGKKVTLNKPMQGDVKKSKVYVKNKKGKVIKVNFGQKGMSIKKNNPERRKAFRARFNCANQKDKTSAAYWSCKAW